jgi:hypothetical protein
MQKRKISLIESVTNTAIGFIISFFVQLIIYPALGIPVKLHQNFVIAVVFTVASIARNYIVRRFFNKIK